MEVSDFPFLVIGARAARVAAKSYIRGMRAKRTAIPIAKRFHSSLEPMAGTRALPAIGSVMSNPQGLRCLAIRRRGLILGSLILRPLILRRLGARCCTPGSGRSAKWRATPSVAGARAARSTPSETREGRRRVRAVVVRHRGHVHWARLRTVMVAS